MTTPKLGRRSFLGTAGSLAAAAPLLGAIGSHGSAQPTGSGNYAATRVTGRRKLGTLEVSSVGIGVQNMSRTYQTTIPHPPETHNIIRTAFERGVTFYDAAEAYGPHEVERILGEGIAPFRDKVVIASKFGWNIDRKPASGARAQQPSRSYQDCRRWHVEAAQDRPDRPALSASGRPGGADRGRRRRDQGPEGRKARCFTGACPNGAADASPRPCRASGQRRSERIFDVVARARERGHPAV